MTDSPKIIDFSWMLGHKSEVEKASLIGDSIRYWAYVLEQGGVPGVRPILTGAMLGAENLHWLSLGLGCKMGKDNIIKKPIKTMDGIPIMTIPGVEQGFHLIFNNKMRVYKKK